VIGCHALARFDPEADFSGWNHRPPAHIEKMGNQRLDVMHRPFLDRRRRQLAVRFVRASWHVLKTLPNDPQALPHFLYMDHDAIIAITMGGDGYIEFELIVA